MPNSENTHTQAIVNALQLQRNVALDNVVSVHAELTVVQEKLKVAETEIENLQKTIDDMVKNQLPNAIPIA